MSSSGADQGGDAGHVQDDGQGMATTGNQRSYLRKTDRRKLGHAQGSG